MTTTNEQTIPAYYYYIDPSSPVYQPQQPNPLDDLISVYGLEDLSRQVARTNPDGTKAVKLRKSYKNQINDLSGKFSSIPTKENTNGGEISRIIFQNNPDMMNNVYNSNNMNREQWRDAMTQRDSALFDQNMDWNMTQNVLGQFEKSYPAEFQSHGFNVDDLAFDLDGSGYSTKSKKRKSKSNGGSSIGTPTSDLQEDIKRRRLE